MSNYPHLFSKWTLRNTEVRNKVVFPPTCPTWVSDPWSGVFTDMAVDYYEERAKGGVGLIIIGGTHVHPSSLSAPMLMPQLHNDNNIEPLRKIADAVHKHDCKLAIQLWHSGMRGYPTYKQSPGFDPDATWYTVAPSQIPLGEFPGASTPKELDEDEIEEILAAYGTAAGRAIAAGLDGVELHLSHGYLPWQFLSPLYNKRTDRWGGSYENRLRFPLEALNRMRAAVGDKPFVGYRINSDSFWPGDLEIGTIKTIVGDIEKRSDIDYVNVSAGVHHTFIHTPMEFKGGWESGYVKQIKEVSTKPVFLVGRITMPDVAENLLAEGAADAICLARQLFTDPEWANKAQEGRADDIRACVAANFCWKSVSRGGRVQCVYNPTIGREGKWGAGSVMKVAQSKRALIIGAGPAGLEYARIAAARGHQITVLEAEQETGGHVRVHSLLPSRTEFGEIARWLADQARKNGAVIKTGVMVDETNLDQILAEYKPDHVVVSTGSKSAYDGFQGWTTEGLPGWESGNCMTWEEVALGRSQSPPRSFPGHAVVIDDMQDVAGPLTAVSLAESGCKSVTLVTRWPMVGMETMTDVYFEWIMPRVYKAGVRVIADHFVKKIDGANVEIYNVYHENARINLPADWIVMSTGRRSVNALFPLLKERKVSAEMIGDATAPRYTYEAVYEGHRQARKL